VVGGAVVGGAVVGGAVGGDVAAGMVAAVVGAGLVAAEVFPVATVPVDPAGAVLGAVFFGLLATPAITAISTMAATSAHIQGVLAIGRFD